jgi:small subunit ribosomal protein S21
MVMPNCPVEMGASSRATLHKRCGNVLRTRPLYQPRSTHEKGEEFLVQVIVRDNNVDQALKALKKKMQREGIFREMKRRRSYEKPSEKRAREQAEAVRRARKLERKRVEREGF